MPVDNTPAAESCGNCLCFREGFCFKDPNPPAGLGEHMAHNRRPPVDPDDWCLSWVDKTKHRP